MSPGALLLANAGDSFTCGHEHGAGDRCISFSYTPEFRERVASGAGVEASRFRTPRLAPLRELSPLIARASAFVAGADDSTFEELGMQLLAEAMRLGNTHQRSNELEASSLARVTRAIRMIDNDPDVPHDLASLALIARLSPYHFLRTFEILTGTTPHQYVLRMRLRRAAVRVRTERARILEIALESGFGDVSNFNRAFRREFGMSPRVYRKG